MTKNAKPISGTDSAPSVSSEIPIDLGETEAASGLFDQSGPEPDDTEPERNYASGALTLCTLTDKLCGLVSYGLTEEEKDDLYNYALPVLQKRDIAIPWAEEIALLTVAGGIVARRIMFWRTGVKLDGDTVSGKEGGWEVGGEEEVDAPDSNVIPKSPSTVPRPWGAA
jgi:hypothetical protein